MRAPGEQDAGWPGALRAWASAESVAPAAAVAAVGAALVDRGDAPSTLAEALGEAFGERGTGRPGHRAPLPPLPRLAGPATLGKAYEAALGSRERRARGAFFTSPQVAHQLVALALGHPAAEPARPHGAVVDPAVGGGAFLIAAADALVGHGGSPGQSAGEGPRLGTGQGHGPGQIAEEDLGRGGRVGIDPETVLGALHGIDIDAAALAVTDVALRWWAHRHLGRWTDLPLALLHADALRDDGAWPASGAAVVVGNPPFLGQLARETARDRSAAVALAARHGRAVHGYVDTSALFLLAAVRATRPGGRVVLVQPESLLVAEHAARARAEVAAAAGLEGVWLGGAGLFAAEVRVCAPVLTVGGAQPDLVRTWLGRSADAGPSVPADRVTARSTWSAVLARSRGVPFCEPRTAGRLGDVARATAGFRDQYYGLAPWVREADGQPVDGQLVDGPLVGGQPVDGQPVGGQPVHERQAGDQSAGDQSDSHEVGDRSASAWPRLVTVGLVDPVVMRWGQEPVRFARRRWRTPVVDLDGLEASDPVLGAWVRQRLVPKLVVATQSSVVEAAVDVEGNWVPSVPCIAVEAPPGLLWHLAAVLNSPVATAWALERYAGAGLSAGAVKLSARQVLDVPLPTDSSAWDEAALSLQVDPGSAGSLIATSRTMLRAYGLEGANDLLRWWARRLPKRLFHDGAEFFGLDA